MNWNELYKELICQNKIEDAIKSVEQNQTFKLSIQLNISIELKILKNKITEGVVYSDFSSEIMFAVYFQDKVVSLGKPFLLDSLKSQKLKLEIEKKVDYNFTFFDFQFIIFLLFSADVSSGQTWFKNSIQEVLQSLEKGKVNLNGYEISNEIELIFWLKNNIYGFNNLEDNEVKKLYT